MVDLSICKPGDILISKHGLKLTYVKKLDPTWEYYDHLVQYPNGSYGSRTNEGFVFRNKRLPEDHDIVEIVQI
jgi:hypothetical protein